MFYRRYNRGCKFISRGVVYAEPRREFRGGVVQCGSSLEKVDLRTADIAAENAAKLAELFPDIVTEVLDEDGNVRHRIDVEALKAHVGDIAEDKRERYQFTWPGKQKARAEVIRPIDKTMRPCPEESVNWDTTENLYIEGDNLDALKILRETYAGKIKMIYIDPPYNTGHDFVYNDDFARSAEEERAESGAFDEEGNVLDAAYKVNNESNGKFHSDWCSMMYPRLVLARDLLSEDGVIFISIDDNEVWNAKRIMDEVFGQGFFISCIAALNNPRGRNQDKYVATCHESLLIFSKRSLEPGAVSIRKTDEEVAADYPEIENGRRYRLLELRNTHRSFGKFNRPNLYYPLYVSENGLVSIDDDPDLIPVYPIWPDGFEGCWTWGKEKSRQEITDLVARQVGDCWKIYRKAWATSDDGKNVFKQVKSLWSDLEITTDKGQADFNSLFDAKDKLFQSPKSVALLSRCIQMGGLDSSIVLDFFSGSATTAHAVMQLNAEDGGSRKFIMVQLPEVCDEKSEAAKAGYSTICEIGKERIRRAGAKIAAEVEESNAQLKLSEEPRRVPDIGFRVLKIDSSNFEEVQRTPDTLCQDALFSLADNVKPGRTPEDILFQLFPKLEIPYTARIDTLDICGKTVYSVDDDTLVACFDARCPRTLFVLWHSASPRGRFCGTRPSRATMHWPTSRRSSRR